MKAIVKKIDGVLRVVEFIDSSLPKYDGERGEYKYSKDVDNAKSYTPHPSYTDYFEENTDNIIDVKLFDHTPESGDSVTYAVPFTPVVDLWDEVVTGFMSEDNISIMEADGAIKLKNYLISNGYNLTKKI